MSTPLIFLSYSRSDSEIAIKITRNIQDFGGNIWLDQLHISGGDRWDTAIEDALEKSTHLIVLLSPASIDSYNVMDEVSYALEEKKTLIPLLIENCKIPFRLRRLQYIDCTKDYELGIKKLIKLIGLSDAESKASLPEPADIHPAQTARKRAEAEKFTEKKPIPKKTKMATSKTMKSNELSDAWKLFEDAQKLNDEDKFDQALKLLKEHAKICRSKNDKISLSFNYSQQILSFMGKDQIGMELKYLDYQEKIDAEVRENQEKYNKIFDKYELVRLKPIDLPPLDLTAFFNSSSGDD